MKSINNRQYIILKIIIHWLLLAKFVIPIICMDSKEPGKGIMNKDLAMSSTNVPIIPSSKASSSQKCSSAESQVLN